MTQHEKDTFGFWLSGLVDGEGCFWFDVNRKRPTACKFAIGLRADDRRVLELIQDYWQCGRIHLVKPKKKKRQKKKLPQLLYIVSTIADLKNILVPHFDRFPLRSKKQRDYLVWRRGVEFSYPIAISPKVRMPGKRGFAPKWTVDQRQFMLNLRDELKITRAFSEV